MSLLIVTDHKGAFLAWEEGREFFFSSQEGHAFILAAAGPGKVTLQHAASQRFLTEALQGVAQESGAHLGFFIGWDRCELAYAYWIAHLPYVWALPSAADPSPSRPCSLGAPAPLRRILGQLHHRPAGIRVRSAASRQAGQAVSPPGMRGAAARRGAVAGAVLPERRRRRVLFAECGQAGGHV